MCKFQALYILVFAGLMIFSCQSGPESKTIPAEEQSQPKAEINYIHQIDGFSSGSGMAQYQGAYYAVGDDDAYLWRFDSAGTVQDKWQVWDTSNVVNNRIEKKVKPDFEALCTFPFEGDTVLLIFGSGSKSPQRDVMLMAYSQSADTATALLASARFYSWLRQAAILGQKELNLEGAAHRYGELILLNRHNNEMYRLPAEELSLFLQYGDTSVLRLRKQRYVLPQINGDSARFSGASILPDGRTLLFSASIEATDNAIDDGKILGSFVGTLDLDAMRPGPLKCWQVYTPDGNSFKGKIEAVEGLLDSDGILHVVGLSDSDDGTTVVLNLSIQPPN